MLIEQNSNEDCQENSRSVLEVVDDSPCDVQLSSKFEFAVLGFVALPLSHLIGRKVTLHLR